MAIEVTIVELVEVLGSVIVVLPESVLSPRNSSVRLTIVDIVSLADLHHL